MEKQKILILTANFGAGHTTAANAIKEYLTNNNLNLFKDFEVIIENFIEVSVPSLNKPLTTLYEISTKYFPSSYNAYYYTMKQIDSKYNIGHFIFLKKLNLYIKDINPTLIISTFPQASACINNLKQNNLICTPLITVVTDVVMSNEWIHKNTDMYFVPTNEIKKSFVKKGINSKNIKVTGIPVNYKFLNITKQQTDKYKIVLMGGARGLFDVKNSFIYWLDEVVHRNKDKLEVVVITGKNKKLYDRFKQSKILKNISILGFVDNIDEVIKDCDLLITKPGGATLFEAINAEVPVVVKKSNVGQEIYNTNFIYQKNIGIVYKKEKELKILVKKLINNELDDLLSDVKFNIESLKDKIDTSNIVLYIEELLYKKEKEH